MLTVFVNIKVDHLDNLKVDLPWQKKYGFFNMDVAG